MNQIDSIPALNWSKHSGEEILRTGQDLIDMSDFAWKLGEVAICGLIYSTFTSPPWMWFALAKDVTMRDLIDFRRLARFIPHGTLIGVKSSYALGIRFAEFYGFVNTGRVVLQQDISYNLFRRS